MIGGGILNEDVKALGINLLNNLIWFVAGACSATVLTMARRSVRPRFWTQMLKGEVVLVVGAHRNFDGYEASGMIGVADALALAEFVSFFKQCKFDNYTVASSRSINSEMFTRNLILIGGPDANATSRDFLERSNKVRKVKFGNPDVNEIWFSLDGQYYAPSHAPSAKDAAVIIFDRSPYSEDAHVILAAGCFGHGTQAAAQTLCRSRSFGKKVRRRDRFEAALTCEVVEHRPMAIKVRQVLPRPIV